MPCPFHRVSSPAAGLPLHEHTHAAPRGNSPFTMAKLQSTSLRHAGIGDLSVASLGCEERKVRLLYPDLCPAIVLHLCERMETSPFVLLL
jgi:hypothetical protein